MNDLHSEIVNIYRVLQDAGQFAELQHRLTWTLYSAEEFAKAIDQGETGSPVDRAWSFFVRQNQGFSGIATCVGNWSRAFVESQGMAHSAADWRNRTRLLEWWHDRLSRVQVDNRCAIEAIKYWDSADTVFYLDPPYILDTRKGKAYKHEQPDEHHEQLVATLLTIDGQSVLSGYDHSIYAPLTAAGWKRREFDVSCDAATKGRGSKMRGKGNTKKHGERTEVVWIKEHEPEGMLF